MLLIGGCAHTNELAKYELSKKGILFVNNTSPDAATIKVVTQTPSDQKKEKNDLLNTIASVGSDILSSSSVDKITNSVRTDSMAVYVSDGLKNALITYLNIEPVSSLQDDPQFVVETTLEECKLVASASSVSVSVRAYARIIDRKSGNIVWDDDETQIIPIRQDYSDTKDNSATLNKVFSAVQLASLSEKQIQHVVNVAAKGAGKEMGETLRKDVIDSRKQ